MKKIVLTAVLGLLSIPAMASVTCEQLPSCETLGYKFSSSECGSKASIKCPFDQTKLFCSDTITCTASQIYDVLNDTCVDAADYCAARKQVYDASTNKCVSCASGDMFDQTTKSCIETCALNDYKAAIPDGNICTKVQSNGKTCYTDCVSASACGTGYADTATNRVYDSSGKAIAVLQDGQYYKPMFYASGGMPYAKLKEALDTGLVAPKKALIAAVNAVMNTTSTYWLKEGCQGGSDETSSGHYIANAGSSVAPCQSNSYYVTHVVAMKDCADTCPYKATLATCDSTKYICEKEDCSGKYFNKGCNTSYYNKTAASTASSSYSCPANTILQKCSSSTLKYRCATCKEAYGYGSAKRDARLEYTISGLNQGYSGLYLDVLITIRNKCGETVAYIEGQIKSGGTTGSLYSNVGLDTSGDYSVEVYLSLTKEYSGAPTKYISYGTLSVDGTNYASTGISGPVDVSLTTSEELLIKVNASVY